MDESRKLSAIVLAQQHAHCTQPTVSVEYPEPEAILLISISNRIQYYYDCTCSISYDVGCTHAHSDVLNTYLQNIEIPKNVKVEVKFGASHVHMWIDSEINISGGVYVWIRMIVNDDVCISILQRIISDLGKEIIKPK
jgi:hypothetical protein